MWGRLIMPLWREEVSELWTKLRVGAAALNSETRSSWIKWFSQFYVAINQLFCEDFQVPSGQKGYSL